MTCVPMEACANCGKHSSDAVELKNCAACRLVKYCSVDCQKTHRKHHNGACKKRAAELKDEQLYTQGHVRPEDAFCPICTLPIPLPISDHSGFFVCCMKRTCNGCFMANKCTGVRSICPFCRTPIEEGDASSIARIQARVDSNDPVAMGYLANQYCSGGYGLEKNVPRAFEMWTKAAELGSIGAHYNLGVLYDDGEGVVQDKTKALRYWEKAAMQGYAEARHNLGAVEGRKGNDERAVRHYLISARMGDERSLNTIKRMFMVGHATKQHYAQALQGYQAATVEMKSPERDKARAFLERKRRQGIVI